MNPFQTLVVLGLAGNAVIASLVWISNPKRRLNRYFMLTTLLIICWLTGMLGITFQTNHQTLLFFGRQVTAAAAFVPLGFFILRLIVLNPGLSFKHLCIKMRYMLFAAFAIACLCQTDFLLNNSQFSSPRETVPIITYQPGFIIYVLYLVAMAAGMMVAVQKTARATSGIQRTESQFILLGWLLGFSFGASLFIFAVLLSTQEVTRFMPLFPLIMNGFVAYGIATHRILSVSVIMQRLTAYLVLILYLIGVYMLAVWIGRFLFHLMIPDTVYLSHLLAALVTALSVIPANSRVQAFSSRLFAENPFNVDEILERAGYIFREMSTEARLMESFSTLITKTFGTTQVILLLPLDEDSYTQCYPVVERGGAVALQSESSLVTLLERDHEPFAIETLERMRPIPLVSSALQEMKTTGASVVLGSFSRKELKAVLLLGSKKSGRIYDLREQKALQLLSDQLAAAIENARLYTEVQDGKIYNEILLDSLSSGIVAVNESREITVFNQRAQQMTGLNEQDTVGRPIHTLPDALADALETVLETEEELRDLEMSIPVGEEEVPLRVSGSLFHSHTGEPLGALLVFNDMTMLKKMEEQIRRTDRLSSIGTLSAGMAHEIKNPLVTIKTFTQLLPHQHEDHDFRNTFFDLVGQEVKRIDTIVNRLLNFARPAKASLRPVSLHEVVDNSLRLVEQQLRQHGIVLHREFNASRHMIEADAEQLNQTFVNFFLNAIHSMGQDGVLTVRTSVVECAVKTPGLNGSHEPNCIQLDVQDTGSGISAENLSRIFDPFFTTKETGVGLGLSVSHGIIQEHKGSIDVESEVGSGTVFHVQFPLLKIREKRQT